MKIKLVAFAVIILFISNNVFAQSVGNSIYNIPFSNYQGAKVNNMNSNQVELEANVMINMKATSYTAIFSITQA